MRGITFCVNGKMAHFRKYYSNSTALSYTVPPVTTVKGILAGLLGCPRDSYYENFSDARCKVGIIVEKPVKKLSQTVNLLKVESLNDLSGDGKNRTQNNMEFLFPKDLRDGYLSYRIYFWHEDDELMERLIECVCTEQKHYNSQGISLALGAAQCLGWISDGRVVELEPMEAGTEELDVSGVILKDRIGRLLPTGMETMALMKEETITEFDQDRRLTLGSKKEILVNLDREPLHVVLKEGTIYYSDGERRFLFVE